MKTFWLVLMRKVRPWNVAVVLAIVAMLATVVQRTRSDIVNPLLHCYLRQEKDCFGYDPGDTGRPAPCNCVSTACNNRVHVYLGTTYNSEKCVEDRFAACDRTLSGSECYEFKEYRDYCLFIRRYSLINCVGVAGASFTIEEPGCFSEGTDH